MIEAQKNKDFTTIYDILFHTAAQILKKKQGHYKDTEWIIDAANDIAIFIMRRYEKNPDYFIINHVSTVSLAYRNVVETHYRKVEELDKITDALPVEEHFDI